jgi:hypothetical protein
MAWINSKRCSLIRGTSAGKPSIIGVCNWGSINPPPGLLRPITFGYLSGKNTSIIF